MAEDSLVLARLASRIKALEENHHQCPPERNIVIDEQVRRARFAVESAHIYSAVWKWVPEQYYSLPLEERAACLNAPSLQNLCKSLLMENKKATTSTAVSDPETYPRYVLVLLQYAATLDVRKLTNAIRALRPVQDRLDDSQFDFRIASEEDNDVITGYRHNSVTPFGLKAMMMEESPLSDSSYRESAEKIKLAGLRIVLAQPIVDLKFLWMGGGHEHLKLGMAVSEFCQSLSPIVADISQPRTMKSGDVGFDD